MEIDEQKHARAAQNIVRKKLRTETNRDFDYT